VFVILSPFFLLENNSLDLPDGLLPCLSSFAGATPFDSIEFNHGTSFRGSLKLTTFPPLHVDSLPSVRNDIKLSNFCAEACVGLPHRTANPCTECTLPAPSRALFFVFFFFFSFFFLLCTEYDLFLSRKAAPQRISSPPQHAPFFQLTRFPLDL